MLIIEQVNVTNQRTRRHEALLTFITRPCMSEWRINVDRPLNSIQ